MQYGVVPIFQGVSFIPICSFVAHFLKFFLTMELPKGYLIAIGGAEDKGEKERQFDLYHESAILRNVVDIIQQHNEPCTIGVVTTASSMPEEVANIYDAAFRKLGITTVEHFNILHREDADLKEVLDRLAQCSGIFFTGGDQLKLAS